MSSMNQERDAFDRLLAYVAPPKDPRPTPVRGNRKTIEEKVGHPIPDFIWAIAAAYGNGQFVDTWGNYLSLHNPYDPCYAKALRNEYETFESVNSDYPDFPYRCHPAPGGLFPIGISTGVMTHFILGSENGWDFVLDERTTYHDPTGYPKFSGLNGYEYVLKFLDNSLLGYELFHPPFKFERDG